MGYFHMRTYSDPSSTSFWGKQIDSLDSTEIAYADHVDRTFQIPFHCPHIVSTYSERLCCRRAELRESQCVAFVITVRDAISKDFAVGNRRTVFQFGVHGHCHNRIGRSNFHVRVPKSRPLERPE